MQVTWIMLCSALVLCAPTPSFGAKRKPSIHRDARSKKKLRAKPVLQKKKRKKKGRKKDTRQATKEATKQPTKETKPAREQIPNLELRLEDTRWMDPAVLRDPLFLSAEKKRGR
jgi:hypothetical protein